MNFQEFAKLAGKAKIKHPRWFALAADRIPSGAEISNAERLLEVALPDDYKQFIRQYGGGYYAFANVFSLDMNSDWYLCAKNREYHYIREPYLRISENGSGDYYGYKGSNRQCSTEIWFFDHEVNQWERTRYQNLFEYLATVALAC